MPLFFESMESRLLLSAAPVAVHAAPVAAPAVVQSVQPAISPQRANIRKLVANLETIAIDSGVTAGQIAALKSDITQIAALATVPSKASVKQLTVDVKADVAAGHKLTSAEEIQLASDATAVLESADVPVDLAVQTVSDFAAVISATHFTSADAKLIAGDLKAIAATFLASH